MNSKAMGQRILTYRLEKGMSRKQMASLIGVGEDTIRKYECGYKTPSLESLVRLANVLEVGTDNLLADKLVITKPINLQGIAKKLEPLTPEQIAIFEDVLDTLLLHADRIAPPDPLY